MGDWGAKVTQEGEDITSPIPEDYVVSSAYNTLKITNEVYGEFAVGDVLDIKEVVSHNLGYIPQYRVYFYNSLSGKWFVPPVVVRESDNVIIMCGYECDDTKFTLEIYPPWFAPISIPSGTVFKWKIYIFANPEGETWT